MARQLVKTLTLIYSPFPIAARNPERSIRAIALSLLIDCGLQKNAPLILLDSLRGLFGTDGCEKFAHLDFHNPRILTSCELPVTIK